MKLLFIVLFSLHGLIAVAQDDIKDVVKNDLTIGNIKHLSTFFTENIDISIDDSDAIYSRSQAAMVLSKFFKDNKVKAFKTEHAGNSSDANQYIIGKMITEKGSYRVTYFISVINNVSKIKQFNIETD